MSVITNIQDGRKIKEEKANMTTGKGCCKRGLNVLLHYETVKIIDIKNKKVGALYRFIQLLIVAYVIGYVIVYKKGYQETDTSISTVSTKVKGTTYVDFGNFNSTFFQGIHVYDPADYVIPAQETNAFFVMTNMIITPRQKESTCPEDPKFKDNYCKDDNECQPKLGTVKNGNGVRTGNCVPSDRNNSVKVCEIYGWCPTEVDFLPMPNNNFSDTIPLLDGTKDATVLIKNQVMFPKFGVNRQNIIEHNDTNYFKNCTYNRETDPLCPIFKLENIVSNAGGNYTRDGFQGAVYGIIIRWDCDLDKGIKNCLPRYEFNRLDDVKSPISPGNNFRYAEFYVEDKVRYRILRKAYGIKFELVVYGKASRFSPMPLFTNLGAGIALLGIATVWCDFIVMYLLKKRDVYRQHKYQRVEDDNSGDDRLKGDESEDEDDSNVPPSHHLLNTS